MNSRFVILLLLSCWCASLRAQTEDYAIDWFSLDCGGGTSSDDVYSVSGTIGQPEASEVADADWTLIGGFWAATVETSSPTLPKLNVTPVGNTLVLSWPASAPGFVLEQNANLLQFDGWHSVNLPVELINGQNTVTVPASGVRVYYRLTDTPTGLRLTITRSEANVILSWPAWATSYFLEQNFDARQAGGWSLVGLQVMLVNGRNTVTVPISSTTALYRLTQSPSLPILRITRSANNVVLSWPAAATGFYLEQNFDIREPNGWSLVGLPVVLTDGRNSVTVPISSATALFRLTLTPGLPTLSIARSAGNVILSWPAAATGFFLEQNFDTTQPKGWSLVRSPVVVSAGRNSVTLPSSNAMAYFRLTQTPSSPSLSIVPSGSYTVISWPASATGFYLEQSFDLTQPLGWSLVDLPVVVLNGRSTVTVPATGKIVYYRLTETPTPLRLVIARSGTNLVLSWPASATGYFLEQNSNLTQPYGWSLVGLPVSVTKGLNTVTIPLSEGMTFYRLTRTAVGPSLQIESTSSSTVTISWPTTSAEFALQRSSGFPTGNWLTLTNKPVVIGNRNQVTIPVSGEEVFFRLKYP